MKAHPRLTYDQLAPGLRDLLARIHALQSVDEGALFEWTLPQVDTLRVEFYAANRPAADFPVWVREQYLAREIERV
jgi:hypothetical protein